ncbi:MAG: hypothetical protein MRY79_08660 [Alphaproteobacteria bacterium]|nr:hypothetical protein [Alphaproteobacteria bacterium]
MKTRKAGWTTRILSSIFVVAVAHALVSLPPPPPEPSLLEQAWNGTKCFAQNLPYTDPLVYNPETSKSGWTMQREIMTECGHKDFWRGLGIFNMIRQVLTFSP